MIPYGENHTCDHGEPWGECCQKPYGMWLREQLVDTVGLDNLPDPEPLIGEDILFGDSLAWMVGKPGSYKSFTALDMAGCIATGEPWQGYRTRQGSVLYLVAEGVRGTKKRVRAWEASYGHRMTGVQFLPVAVQSKVDGHWSELVELARELRPALIVLDTQARITVGVDENSNSEMGEFIDKTERLRKACRACVILVHHIGRNGDTGRGATAVDGAVTTVIKVEKDGTDVSLICQKNKDGEEWEPIKLRAVSMGASVVLAIADGTSAPAGPSSAAMKTARDWWALHGDMWVSASKLSDVVVPKSTFYRHMRELEKHGFVKVDAAGRYPRYQLTGDPAGDNGE